MAALPALLCGGLRGMGSATPLLAAAAPSLQALAALLNPGLLPSPAARALATTSSATGRTGKDGAKPHGGAAAAAHPGTETSSSSSSSSSGSSSAPQLHVVVEPLSDAHEGVSVISLTRGEARNAIGRQLLRELSEGLDTLRQERSTRCVLLRSQVPGVFCAGADLKERATMTQSETAEFVSRLRRTFTELQDLPMPTIAVVEGLALGGGAEMALACDFRVMGTGATLAFPETQLGIIPGAGGTQRLPRIVGASRAKELIFTGRRLNGEEAKELRLADHVVPDGKVYERALELAAMIVRGAPLSMRQAKAAINRGMDVDLHTGLAVEEAMYAQLLPTKDRLEGLKAFAEKRPPVYKGE